MSAQSEPRVFSVPMELHVIADSAEEALALAYGAAEEVYGASDGEQTGPHSLLVATGDPDDLDVVES